MDRLLVTDSCCEFNQSLKSLDEKRIRIPFLIDVDEDRFVDDGSIDTGKLIEKMRESSNAPKTAAPTPYDFLKAFEKGRECLCVTISSKLSACYSNACLAKKMAEEGGEKLIHIFDSKSAVAGETLIAMKINKLLEEGINFQEIVSKMETFISEMKTYFVLDNIDNLLKNGRLSKVQGFLANVLSIKPICCGDDGEIKMLDKTRGIKKALSKLVEIIGQDRDLIKDRDVIISHCHASENAEKIKREIQERYSPKSIQIVETEGLSTVYADDGGIVISY